MHCTGSWFKQPQNKSAAIWTANFIGFLSGRPDCYQVARSTADLEVEDRRRLDRRAVLVLVECGFEQPLLLVGLFVRLLRSAGTARPSRLAPSASGQRSSRPDGRSSDPSSHHLSPAVTTHASCGCARLCGLPPTSSSVPRLLIVDRNVAPQAARARHCVEPTRRHTQLVEMPRHDTSGGAFARRRCALRKNAELEDERRQPASRQDRLRPWQRILLGSGLPAGYVESGSWSRCCCCSDSAAHPAKTRSNGRR